MEYPRLDLTPSSRLRYISQVDFANEHVTADQCNAVIMALAGDPKVSASGVGLLAVLYAHALDDKPHREIECSEHDLAALSTIKYAYPYVPEDGKLHVRLFLVGHACPAAVVDRWYQPDPVGYTPTGAESTAPRPSDPGPWTSGEKAVCKFCGTEQPVVHRITNQRSSGTQYVGDVAAH